MIKVIIVDDQVLLRESIKFIIEEDTDIEVVGMANNGLEALKLCEEAVPNLVLMDIMMPICNGIEGTKLIKEKFNSIKILVLTTFKDDENIKKALRNGADGYILKDIKPDELLLAIKSIFKGFSILDQNAQEVMLKNTSTPPLPNLNKKDDIIENYKLTDRDLSIIQFIVEGKNNKEIAKELYVTEGTIKNLISSIYDKLNVKDRTQLAVFAVKNDLA